MASSSYRNLAPWLGGGGGAGAGRMGGLCVGAYAFSVGWVWQASATWINMLNEYPFTYDPAFDGKMVGNEQIEPIDTLAYLWSGKKPVQLAPTSALPLRSRDAGPPWLSAPRSHGAHENQRHDGGHGAGASNRRHRYRCGGCQRP